MASTFSSLPHFFRRGQARLIDEDLERAVADFDRAAALNRGNTFLATLVHSHRGYAFVLLGRKDEAKKEFDRVERLSNGKPILLQLQLMNIEAQIKERR